MKKVLAVLLSSLAISLTVAAQTSSLDCLFNWAEANYADYFAPAPAATIDWPPYQYRYYGLTQAYLGATTDTLYYLGPLTGNELTSLGPLDGWIATAGCTTVSSYAPARISATWATTGSGDPTDRKDVAATEWKGEICRPEGLFPTLKTYAGDEYVASTTMLYVENRLCNLSVTIGVCRTAGTSAEPSDSNLKNKECARDPYDTAPASLYYTNLLPGSKLFISLVKPGASINIFYCGNQQGLFQGVVPSASGPLTCLPH